MKVWKLAAAIGCICLISNTSPLFSAYAGNEGISTAAADIIASSEDLKELDAYMRQRLGQKIRLGRNSGAASESAPDASESSDYVIMSKAEYMLDQNGKANRNPHSAGKKAKKTVDKKPDASKILSGLHLEGAKKVYLYSNELLEKMQKDAPLDGERFSWQVPIINAAGENGLAYLKKSEATGSFITTGVEFPVKSEKAFLSNDEITGLVSEATGNTASIEAIYFVDMPISIMGTVVGAAVLDSGSIIFVAVENAPYYNGMEFQQTYSFDEMTRYLEIFAKKAEGWLRTYP